MHIMSHNNQTLCYTGLYSNSGNSKVLSSPYCIWHYLHSHELNTWKKVIAGGPGLDSQLAALGFSLPAAWLTNIDGMKDLHVVLYSTAWLLSL